MSSLDDYNKQMEAEWEQPHGFLGYLRMGHFDEEKFLRLQRLLGSLNIPPEQRSIDRRLVELIWIIPLFMTWQKERISERGEDISRLDQAISSIESELFRILGNP